MSILRVALLVIREDAKDTTALHYAGLNREQTDATSGNSADGIETHARKIVADKWLYIPHFNMLTVTHLES